MSAVPDTHDNPAVLQCTGLSKSFTEGGLNVTVLENINLTVEPGEQVAIVGASGSGKSTLLHLLGGLDTPTQGEVFVNGVLMNRLSEAARGRVRNRSLGFVYQFHHLLPEFSALENVAMPLYIRRVPRAEADERARALPSLAERTDRWVRAALRRRGPPGP